MHVKRVLGDEVFVCRREIDPKPRPKSIVILISYSGETKTVLSWFEGFRKISANIIAVSGFKDSTISREANHRLIFGGDGEVSPGSGIRWTKGVNQFYEQAAYVLSPMPIDLCNKLNEMGYEIPERWLKLQHSAVS
jgi:D-arabinose 5-phosphate isomerase GutQ